MPFPRVHEPILGFTHQAVSTLLVSVGNCRFLNVNMPFVTAPITVYSYLFLCIHAYLWVYV